MALVALVGTDIALLEGLAQTLAAGGHRPVIAASVGEARELLQAETPLVVVVGRSQAEDAGGLRHLPLQRGGALLLYRGAADDVRAIPAGLQRMVLAELVLPLERARLVRLVASVAARATATGQSSGAPDPGVRYEGRADLRG